MAEMKREQRDALIAIITKCEELVSENEALKAVLTVIEKHGPFTHSTWQQEVAALQASPGRQKYREVVAPILQQIDSAFRDSELARLFRETPIKGPIQ